jgi:hypothetical protein
MWRNDFRYRRPDPANTLKRLQRSERTQRVTVGDDALGERRPDAWKTLQLIGGRAIEVDEWSWPSLPALPGAVSGSATTAAARLPLAARVGGYAPRRIDGRDLLPELLAGGTIHLGRITQRAGGANGSPEEEQTCEKGERPALRRRSHGSEKRPTITTPRPRPSPYRRAPKQPTTWRDRQPVALMS